MYRGVGGLKGGWTQEKRHGNLALSFESADVAG